MRWILLLILSLLTLSLLGCSGKEENQVKFDVIGKGYFSNVAEKKYMVIRSTDEFRDFVNETGVIFQPPDFNTTMVIAVFMGERKTGGYEINIGKILEEDGKLVVYVDLYEPSDTCLVTSVITSPFQVVKLKKFDGRVEFVETVREIKC
ncbi:MAG: protease complex subunit PrcB family protein [Archaeoglobi archaeon]|nr:protease complex subunit PrcB family protein [Archaeoglobi archaeon]